MALGLQGLSARERLRISLLLSSFEAGMPLVGLALGRLIGSAVGSAADYGAIAILGFVGVWMLLTSDEAEQQRVTKLSRGHGLALVTLGIGIGVSLDELAMGFSVGLLHFSVWLAVALIGVQAFLVAQLGMRLGSRGSEFLRESAERGAAVALIGLAVLLLAEKCRVDAGASSFTQPRPIRLITAAWASRDNQGREVSRRAASRSLCVSTGGAAGECFGDGGRVRRCRR